ncbi:MAG: septal ring lytic transglycosylase RlpA family protein [Gammaproteobacteria bacterium]|nr:MAG: septal ring lytic transglycosylase RlpA family protein [Gammaproteobacteria bacterium]
METRDGPPRDPVDLSGIPDAVPKREPKSAYGNPRSYEVFGKRYQVRASSKGYRERGMASWYGKKFHGRRTSSGEIYDMYAMTAAHRTLPLPSYVEVTNLKNGRKVVVRVNDRGPFAKDRIIDLSYAAAYKLGILKEGTAPVMIEAIDVDIPVYVQAGAFSRKVHAEKLRKRLQAEGIRKVHLNEGRGMYRVWVGPFRRESEARHLAHRLADMGLERPFLTWERKAHESF